MCGVNSYWVFWEDLRWPNSDPNAAAGADAGAPPPRCAAGHVMAVSSFAGEGVTSNYYEG